MDTLHATPVPGLPVICATPPAPGAILEGYRVVDAPSSVFCKPRPANLNWRGWASIAVLALVFWPVSCVPCFTACSYSAYQEPVYSTPTSTDAN
jgi:hypothetical protein